MPPPPVTGLSRSWVPLWQRLLAQRELANLVSAGRESVSRALAKLRNQGKVRLDDGWAVLLD